MIFFLNTRVPQYKRTIIYKYFDKRHDSNGNYRATILEMRDYIFVFVCAYAHIIFKLITHIKCSSMNSPLSKAIIASVKNQ